MADLVFCRCDERSRAAIFEGFRFEAEYKGWVFPNDKPREVFNQWLNSYHETENHDGEPFVYTNCPYCGHDLPFIDPPPPAEFCNGED